jgi:hypothetical protein
VATGGGLLAALFRDVRSLDAERARQPDGSPAPGLPAVGHQSWPERQGEPFTGMEEIGVGRRRAVGPDEGLPVRRGL